MKHPLPPLDGLKVFEAAARHLSFSKAADELCITKGAVSYQIRKLEQHIDCQLFRRSVRQVYLTDAGQRLLQTTREVFDALNSSLDRLKPRNRYDVRIAATTYVAARWLSPRVAKFLEKHPDTSIRFEHGINRGDFTLDDIDIAMRWGRCTGRYSADQGRELPMSLYPVCNPQLAESLKNHPENLYQLTLLSENRDQDLWLEWFGHDHLNNPRQVIEDANVRVQAAIDGQGLILADDLMQFEVDTGLLVAPLEKQLIGYGYFLLRTPTQPHNLEANALADWLLNQH
ncbi:MAG: LysR family transcriptional regulator [bacterium]